VFSVPNSGLIMMGSRSENAFGDSLEISWTHPDVAWPNQVHQKIANP
jgi:hypothetical protein